MALAPNQQLLDVHRKSFIGRLERSSFQDQRLSDVGVAFGQQITARVGLKLPASQERIVEQTRWLYLRYVFVKLRQNALPLRDLNLTKSSRQRRAAAAAAAATAAAASPNLAATRVVSKPPRISVPLIRLPSDSSSLSSSKRRHHPGSPTASSTSSSARSSGGAGANLLQASINNFNSMTRHPSIISPSSSSSPLNGMVAAATTTAAAGINVTNNGASSRKFVMDPTINNQIFNVIWSIVNELRDVKPEFFGDTIYEHIGLDKFSSLQNLLNVQLTICQEMIRSDISWCRIAALFSLFGAMSLDCVRLGAPEHVGPILDGFIEFVERDLALWISQQGGWESFLYKFRSGHSLRKFALNLLGGLIVPLTAVLLCLHYS